jgi:DNA-binding CsgD family transcriptional regulator
MIIISRRVFMNDLFDLIVRMRPVSEKFSNIMLFVKDTQGKYLYASTSLLEFFGKASSDVLYKKYEDVWGHNTARLRPVMEEESMLLSGKCRVIDRNIRLENSMREERYFRVFKTALYSENEDEIIGIIGVGLDITGDRGMLFTLFHIFFRQLSKSEKRYFFFRSDGLTRGEIARLMDTTIETIDSYRRRIMKKFKVDEREMMLLENIYRLFLNESYAS